MPQAEKPSTTRRALFAAPAAIAALGMLPGVSHAADLRTRWHELQKERARVEGRRDLTEEQIGAFIDDWHDRQGEILRTPIRSREDALVKLDCAATMTVWGVRTDALDIDAVGEVAAYFRRQA